ncbi:GNAT family N-acetyltransferase [Streptomyces sp. NBC_00696]|uniref:GNAT family N-acetyltransferase n=1 Tax=Streptomyces sp. NBC_00696 TaxID=2903672 RepID=UPI002E33D47E|nr:GNAT family N-acetyltransferase [Streptomyces sp. NBC_00696]
MPPIDASVDSATVPSFVPGTSPSTSAAASASQSPSTDCEDTLNLRLPEEFFALCAETDHHAAASNEVTPDPDAAVPDPAADGEVDPIARQNPTEDAEGTSWVAFDAVPTPDATPTSDGPPNPNISPRTYTPPTADLLDRIDGWGPTDTPAGPFHLLPVHIERDLPLIHRWMNDPAVAEFWELDGPQALTENHLRDQLTGDGRSVPCLGVLDGTPMSYWEIYRADLDPLARHYPARPHDTGIHLLVGNVTDRGRGLGGTLLRAVADLVLDKRPACARVIAEPDIRNTPSVAAFLGAGFRFSAEADLPDKRAALMVRDRSLRDLL